MRRTVAINDSLHELINKWRAVVLLAADVDLSYNEVLNLTVLWGLISVDATKNFGVDVDALGQEILNDNPEVLVRLCEMRTNPKLLTRLLACFSVLSVYALPSVPSRLCPAAT